MAELKTEQSRILDACLTKERVGRLVDMMPEYNERYVWNDLGNGNLFADLFADVARYVPERKLWYLYDGRVWRPDAGGMGAMQLCKELARILGAYAAIVRDERVRLDYAKYVRRWQNRRERETILRDAAAVYPTPLSAFDADPYLLNCQNGTLDLRTRAFRPHDPGDGCSRMAGVDYDPDARCPEWEKFIAEVMQGDAERALFLQKALGYALTGSTRHECFFILYGATSRNGKGTAMETFLRLMGDYGRSARPETLAQRQNPGGAQPSEDIARLAGARFVNLSEPDKQMALSAALVKTLTGNDTITARYLHENSFEYRPQFKLFINTNYLPQVNDLTLFSSGRVKLIPFERHFTEAERDTGLKQRLAQPASLSGILNWCLEGLWLLEETGFAMPESVQRATDAYRYLSDKVGRFLHEVLEADPNGELLLTDAYQLYTAWCMRSGLRPESLPNFRRELGSQAELKNKRPAGGGRRASARSMVLGYRMPADAAVKIASAGERNLPAPMLSLR